MKEVTLREWVDSLGSGRVHCTKLRKHNGGYDALIRKENWAFPTWLWVPPHVKITDREEQILLEQEDEVR